MERSSIESSSQWLDSQRNEQENVSDSMQISLSMADAPALIKDAERVSKQLGVIYDNYQDTYKLLKDKGLVDDLEAVQREVRLVDSLRKSGRMGEVPAALQRAATRAKKYNKEMSALQGLAKKYYSGHVEGVERFARGEGNQPASVQSSVKPQDLNVFLQEMFPESYTSQAVRYATGQNRNELHWTQKVAMAPGVGLESVVRSAASLFNSSTYEQFAITVSQVCRMSVQDWTDLWSTVKFTASNMDNGTKAAYGISIISSMIFLYGGLSNFSKVAGGLKSFSKIKGMLNAMYSAGSLLKVGSNIGPIIPLAIVGGITLNNQVLLKA